jgi:threonine dehydrogenase-like Zn-dependent dehydrogenase
MRGVLFQGERKLQLAELPEPVPGPNEVVVRMEASGLCGSDLRAYRGPARGSAAKVGGHEPAGVVVAAGIGVSKDWVGRSVMVHHYFGCGTCDQCLSGWTQMCRRGTLAMGDTTDGSHADLFTVPFSTVIEMPEGLSYLAAAAISCGTGTAWAALKRLNLTGDDTIAIFGQGPVGLAATQLAGAMGARVIALDISLARLERSAELGAWETVDPSNLDSVNDVVRDLTGGRGVAKSLETSGASSAAQNALQVLDLWGTACYVGVGSTIHFDLAEHLRKQMTTVVSWTMSKSQMLDCARFVLDREVSVDALFSDRWTLSQFVEAYERFDLQTSGKGVFVPGA